MKIVIAPDSFKGSLSASKVAESITLGINKVLPEAEIVELPLSDGGEGLVDALVKATGGETLYQQVTGPLGLPVDSFWGLLGDGKTAVIEMAAASGLNLVPKEERNPLKTTSFGTGELICSAVNQGCSKLIIGIGGSATNDGGVGMAQALGVRFLDEKGKELPFGGGELIRLNSIDTSRIDFCLKDIDVQVACDVNNPLTGCQGASYVYGPQKGATKAMVQDLDKGLKHYARILNKDLGIEIENIPGSGAAGGLGAGLMAFLNGKLTSGIDLVMEVIDFEKHLSHASLVFTGEGALDSQSLFGKVPVGVARKAKKNNVPVVVIAGSIIENLEIFHEEGITASFSIINKPLELKDALSKTAVLLELTVKEIMNLYVHLLNNFSKKGKINN